VYPDSEIDGTIPRSLRLLNRRTAPVMAENMAEVAIVREARDVILERSNDLPVIETSGESGGLKAWRSGSEGRLAMRTGKEAEF
jgi:hypothetical protein